MARIRIEMDVPGWAIDPKTGELTDAAYDEIMSGVDTLGTNIEIEEI